MEVKRERDGARSVSLAPSVIESRRVKNQSDGATRGWSSHDKTERQGSTVPGLLLVFAGDRPALGGLEVGATPIVLGRGSVGRLTLDDDRLSRRHVEVALEGRTWTIRDLGSRNGTSVDGRLISREPLRTDEARVLRAGDTVFLLCSDLRPSLAVDIEVREGVVVGPSLRQAWTQIESIARSSEVLHINGAAGSGKETAARHFHRSGPCSSGPFVAVDCAALPGALAERMLFGTRGGATGSDAEVAGSILSAHGGTLFIDHLSDLDPGVQARLLRVLESHEVIPLGDARGRKLDLRVCSASHGDLKAQVEAGGFREELFLRLGRPSVALPSLSQRSEEIPWIIRELLRHRTPSKAHASLVETALLRPWPGNLRELAVEIRDAAQAAHADGNDQVEARHLSSEAGLAKSLRAPSHGDPKQASATVSKTPMERAADRPSPDSRQMPDRQMPDPHMPDRQVPDRQMPDRQMPDRQMIIQALRREGGNVARAGEALGATRVELERWMERYAIVVADEVKREGGGDA